MLKHLGELRKNALGGSGPIIRERSDALEQGPPGILDGTANRAGLREARAHGVECFQDASAGSLSAFEADD